MLIYLQMLESEEDRTKFAQIYEKYRGLMMHVAKKFLNNHFDAEDAVHQSFLAVIENIHKVSDVTSPEKRFSELPPAVKISCRFPFTSLFWARSAGPRFR